MVVDQEEVMDVKFPEKSDFGSLERKRKAIYKQHCRYKRMSFYPNNYAWMVDGENNYTEEISEAKRYVRRYGFKGSKALKKQCNRKIRRSSKLNMLNMSNGLYRKATEYWWMFY